MAVGGEVSFLLVQAELASLHQSHGRKSLPWLWLHYASRLNSSVRPRMKLLAVLVLLLQASASYSQPAEHCPVLPADSGMTWSYKQGPDFGVCYAVDSSTGKDAFGIYLGYAPKFDPSHGNAIGAGNVGGRKDRKSTRLNYSH